MSRRVIWGIGVLLLATAGPAAAQTNSSSTGSIPKSNKTLPSSGTGTGGLNLTAPIPKAGGSSGRFKSGTGTGSTTTSGTTTGSGVSGGSGTGLGAGSGMGTGTGSGMGTGTGGTGLSSAAEIALLAQARLFVTELESAGNLSLNRRESRMLTLLLYEALRQQAGASGTGTGSSGSTTTGGTGTGSTPMIGSTTSRP